MRALATEAVAWGFAAYDRRWEHVARIGAEEAVALDTRAHGWRYLSLNALLLDTPEAIQLRRLTRRFGHLLDVATHAVLEDAAWWSELAWPWPAIELARHEPRHPHGRTTLYGRFDWLLDEARGWQLVEYNADTPSGGREVSGLDPAVYRLYGGRTAGLVRLSQGFPARLAATLSARLAQHAASSRRPVRLVGVVSSHSWVEDMAQAWWLAGLLRAHGQPALVGDVADLEVRRGRVLLRGEPLDALYRFYPFERLYRHGLFAPLLEAAIDGQVLLLNGLRGFLAQSKAILAWLWLHRDDPVLGRGAREVIEAHLPATFPARSDEAAHLLPGAVVKHVNGREGDLVVFGETLDADAWERRLLEGGYVVQRKVHQVAVEDVAVDERAPALQVVAPRYACIGAFCIGGEFGGCYTRLDGPITGARAAFAATFAARRRYAP